jgi:uncharacterized protein YndB with AHSA1/START domain
VADQVAAVAEFTQTPPDWEEPDPDDQTTVVTLSLLEVGQATELSLRQGQFATEARLALHRDGWTDSFNKLRELLKPDSGGKA